MVKRKLSRKELKEDEVLTFAQKVYTWARERKQPLIYGSVILLCFILLMGFIRSYERSRANHAGQVLSKAFEGDQVDKAILQRVAKRYKHTPAGKIAQAYKYIKDKNMDGLKAILPSIKSPVTRGFIIIDLIQILLDKKQYAQAKDFLEGQKKALPEDFVLFLQAIILEKEGQREEAKGLYEKINKTFEDSPLKSEAQTRAQML